jgi:hypothetical protein
LNALLELTGVPGERSHPYVDGKFTGDGAFQDDVPFTVTIVKRVDIILYLSPLSAFVVWRRHDADDDRRNMVRVASFAELDGCFD